MKTICVPKTKAAMERLHYDECLPDDCFKMSLDQNGLDNLWVLGIFKEINQRLDLMIDDFEEEEIVGKANLVIAREIFAKYMAIGNSQDLYAIYTLIENAIACDTGIFFFF